MSLLRPGSSLVRPISDGPCSGCLRPASPMAHQDVPGHFRWAGSEPSESSQGSLYRSGVPPLGSFILSPSALRLLRLLHPRAPTCPGISPLPAPLLSRPVLRGADAEKVRQDRLCSPEVRRFSAGRRVTSALPANLESGSPRSLEHCSCPAGVRGWASLCAPRERWQAPPHPAAHAYTCVHTHSQLRQRTCRHAHAPVTQGTRSDPHTHTYT